MQWLRTLSESDCYLRCHGDRTGNVSLIETTVRIRDHSFDRAPQDPKLTPVRDDNRTERRPEQAADAA